MQNAEFDQYADQYEEMHARSIRFSGESPDYFAAYKIAIMKRHAPALLAPHRILDFGAGIGNSVEHVRRSYPQSSIMLADPSAKSLAIARQRFPGVAETSHIVGGSLPFDDGSFELAFAACVFHHADASLHVSMMKELRRVLVPGGSLFIFEHNPANPLTRKAVRDCPFDEDAVLIKPRQLCSRLRLAGFDGARPRYYVFFPAMLRGLRPLEPWLASVPLGGQYYVQARK